MLVEHKTVNPVIRSKFVGQCTTVSQACLRTERLKKNDYNNKCNSQIDQYQLRNSKVLDIERVDPNTSVQNTYAKFKSNSSEISSCHQ